jgi:alpha-tubulin suppressor-like RCC1 family protein
VPEPTVLSTPFTAVHVVMGDEFSCAVDDLNEVHCWGDNTLGELGIGTLVLPGQGGFNTPVPQKSGVGSFLALDTSGDTPALAAGAEHACVAAGGTVYCWGSNGSGQVGMGSKSASEPTPRNVTSARTVAAGCMAKHTCTVDSKSGSLSCWGNNADGEIGIGSVNEVLRPTTIPIAGVRAVALGETHSCALVTGGTLYCWGANDKGQLGFASAAVVTSPHPSDVVAEVCR